MARKLSGRALAQFEAGRDVWQETLDGVREIKAGRGKRTVVEPRSTVARVAESRAMNKHIGSELDEFLQEEGLLAEAEAAAVKRVLAYQIAQEMKERNISKSALARKMRTSRSSLDRLLDPGNPSVTLLTLESVALALGKRLKVQLG